MIKNKLIVQEMMKDTYSKDRGYKTMNYFVIINNKF